MGMSVDGRDRSSSSQRSSMSDMSSLSRDCGESRQSVDSAKKLQPLTIARHDTENPFLSDPSPLGLAQLRKHSEPDISSDYPCSLNLAASWDAALAARASPVGSPGMGCLFRSQSEARQSPLRNCYSSTGGTLKSDAALPIVMPGSPAPPSPSGSQASTPPLSARIHNSPFLSEGSLATCQCARLSLDSSSSRAETAHTALCNRLEAKLARARGEPLTPYLM
eukprot:jgi/Ulvmu1/7153/UM034_0060.1